MRTRMLPLLSLLLPVLFTFTSPGGVGAAAPNGPEAPSRQAPDAIQAGALRIVHVNVGQGDATLIVGPSSVLLFDAGPTGAGTALRAALDRLGITAIDYFVAGHYHEDHIGGIDELIRGGISLTTAAYDRGGRYSSDAFTDYLRVVGRRRQTIKLNQQIDLGGGAIATALAVNGHTNHGDVPVTDENSRSIALVVRYGGFDYFIASDLTGGGTTNGQATADIESPVSRDVGDVDVMHVGHHGSNTSTNQTLVDTLKPEHAVISCGDGNSFGHPTQGVLDRLTSASSLDTIWQTERGDGGWSPAVRVGGDITFSTDGASYTVTMTASKETFTYPVDVETSPEGGVVINEVAWAGSASSAYDEWIELYNDSDASISLSGWQVVDDGGAQVYALSGSIGARGYYLIERAANATSVGGDVTASGLSLANDGDALVLQAADGRRVDAVNLAGQAWYAGSTSGPRSMERIFAHAPGDDAANWATHDGSVRNGVDSGGRAINGTPRAKNAASE